MALRFYVDTCVWWDWLGWRDGISRNWTHQERQDLAAFDQVASHIGQSAHRGATFLRSELVLLELGPRRSQIFQETVMPPLIKVAIPLTRADARYGYDGSMLRGGRMGGKLRPLLEVDGYQHDDRLAQAAATLTQDQHLYGLPARKRAFDIEHMEAALEAETDLLVTVDRSTILHRDRALREQFRSDAAITRAIDFSVTPGEALERIKLWSLGRR
jgi:hypothetical protein